jgi:hypothetical protein
VLQLPLPVLQLPLQVLQLPLPVLQLPLPVLQLPLQVLQLSLPVLQLPLQVAQASRASPALLLRPALPPAPKRPFSPAQLPVFKSPSWAPDEWLWLPRAWLSWVTLLPSFKS